MGAMHAHELEWIHRLQDALRSPWMDRIFLGWNYIDSLGFLLLVLVLVWYLVDRRIGIRLAYILMLSSVVNVFLKYFFGLPRPCQIDPSVSVICSAAPGFPSGAAQTAIILAVVIILECRKRLYWYLGLVFAFLLCFSRIYLGLHYFTDILGGLASGGLLLLIYWKVFPIMEKQWKIAILLFPLLLLIIGQSSALFFFWSSIGIAIGLLLNEKFKIDTKGSWRKRSLQALTVLIGLTLFALMFYKGNSSLKWLFGLGAGLWLSHLGAWSVQKLTRSR